MKAAEKIAIGSDHAGFEAKERIKQLLEQSGIAFEDFGTHSSESCDYPDYARKVATAVSRGGSARGILCCGSGIGVSMVANKVRGVRAALCRDEEAARLSRQHNNANILCIAGRATSPEELDKIIKAWLSAEFEGGRHQRRIEKIETVRQGESSWQEHVKEPEQTVK